MKLIHLYADGACSGNPGQGGYGIILRYIKDENSDVFEKEFYKGFRYTTNNRMELLSIIDGLKKLKYPCKVKVFSDSKYVTDAINKHWLIKWQENDWKNSSGNVKNNDLWEELLILLDIHKVEFIWVKGHSSNKFNNRCDELAVQARSNNAINIDNGYENQFQKQVTDKCECGGQYIEQSYILTSYPSQKEYICNKCGNKKRIKC